SRVVYPLPLHDALPISLLGGLFAARQPAVLAPALAEKMGALDTIDGLRSLLDRVAALLRAQAAGIFGNLLVVVPVVAALGFGLEIEEHTSELQSRENLV